MRSDSMTGEEGDTLNTRHTMHEDISDKNKHRQAMLTLARRDATKLLHSTALQQTDSIETRFCFAS